MRRWIWLVIALLAMSCSGPDKPEGWRIERQAADDTATTSTICTDVESVALGDLADHRDIEPVLDELSRLAAVLGATAALPAFDTIRSALATEGVDVDFDEELLAAADALDEAGWAACGVPLFTAMYAAAGWPYCHGELDVAVTLYMSAPDPGTTSCTSTGVPLFLPCWQVTADGYLPIDCLSETVVTAADGSWVEAGAPRTTTTTTTTTTTPASTTTTEPVVEAIGRPECTDLAALFTGPDPLRGDATDLQRILDSTSVLGAFIIDLASDFEHATEGGSELEVFEQIVIDLDTATVEACGIPVISGAYHFVGGIAELPCWAPTGNAYPSYEPISCA